MSSIFLLLLLVLSASAAQAEGTCSALPGPPGRDGRDGMPGNPGTCSYSDIRRIKEEIQTEIEQSLRLAVNELLQNQTVGNCTQDQLSKNETSDPCKNETSDPINDCPEDLGEMSSPAESCLQIYNCQPSSPSGQYWIQTAAGENAVQIYCNLETQLNGTRGWARVAYINMTEDGAQCPVSLRTVTENQKTICTQEDSYGGLCTSVNFAVQGKRYSKICGQAVGYQKGSTDGFEGPADINSYYVDGISITYGSPRKHVWTYAAGLSDDNNYGNNNCPCAKYPGRSPPSFVGDHYYCESGNTGNYDLTTFHSNDPLWDGDGCGADNNCCSQPGMPWFCRTLPPQEVDEDIEMRVCRIGPGHLIIDEKVYLELLEIYIQ